MLINIKNVLELLQQKVNAVDSSTSIKDLEYLLKASKKAARSVIYEVDSDGSLPDPTTTNTRIAFVQTRGVVAYNNNRWDYLPSQNLSSEQPAWVFQGTVAGYVSAGRTGPSTTTSNIEKFSFPYEYTHGIIGTLTSGNRSLVAGQSSETAGYTSGAESPTTAQVNKMLFASDTSGIDALDLSIIRRYLSGQSSSVNGYTAGGQAPTPTVVMYNVIDKFPFAADTNATDVGDLTITVRDLTGISSASNGYTAGGEVYLSGYSDIINKFAFASDGNAVISGNLTAVSKQHSGQSSESNGYVSAGYVGVSPVAIDTIQKFPFASDTNAAGVGALTQEKYYNIGQSSTTNGYSSGGFFNPPGYLATIEKFSFVSDGNGAFVANMSGLRGAGAGQQV